MSCFGDLMDNALIPIKNLIRIKEAKKGYEKIKEIGQRVDGVKKKVLFHLIRSIPSSPLSYFESILAHALQYRGASCQILFCGSYFNDCDANYYFSSHKEFCKRCSFFRKEFIESLGISPLFYDKFISVTEKSEIEKIVEGLAFSEYESFHYKGVNVGYIAKSTLIRYYQHFYLPQTAEAQLKYKNALIRTMSVVQIAENVYNKEKPDILITLHGIYSAWEPFYVFLKNKGVTCYVYHFCMAEIHGVRFIKNGRDLEKINHHGWEMIKNRELTEGEKKEYDTFLNERHLFKRGYVSLLTEGLELDISSKSKFEEFLQKDFKKRFAIFTNIPWDNALIYGDRVFKSIFEWFDKCIEFFILRPDCQLIIKVHPAERLDINSYTFTKYISEKYPSLPENIFFMSNDTSVKPYELFDKIDVGLVYTGTLGLEMAISGVPVLAGGVANYTEVEGIVYPIKNIDEYFDLMIDPKEVIKFAKESRNIAYKYGYLFFRQTEVPMPFFKENKLAVFDPSSLDRLKEIVTEDPIIDFVSRQILDEQEVVRPSIL
jgi:Capsule polysaccharide biosynthesis protein